MATNDTTVVQKREIVSKKTLQAEGLKFAVKNSTSCLYILHDCIR